MSVQPPAPLPTRADTGAAVMNTSSNRNSVSSNGVNGNTSNRNSINSTKTDPNTTTTKDSNNASQPPPPQHPSVNSLSEAARTAQAFFEAARAFTASASFHGTAELIDEIPRLRRVAADKEKELRALSAALEEQQQRHAAALADERRDRDRIGAAFLDTYNKEYERHRGESRELAAKIDALEAEVRRQKEDIARLHKSDEELVRQGRQARGLLEQEKEKCEKAAKVIADMKRDMEKRAEAARKEAEKKGAEIAGLAAQLKKAETEANKAKSSLMTCHRENEDLQRDLEDTTERLAELESFAEPLSDEKWETS